MQLKNQKDFFSGLLSAAMGLLFAWTASRYSIGTAQRMGPGYFPLLLGALLTLLGGLVVFKALVFETEDGGRTGAWAWRPVGLVLLAGLLLGWLLERVDALGWLPAHVPWAAWSPLVGGRDALAPLLGQLPLTFGPPEYCALIVLCLAAAMLLGYGLLLKTLSMVLLGLLLGLVGADPASGLVRFAFEIPELGDGIGFAVLVLGLLVYGGAVRRLARPGPHPLSRPTLFGARRWPRLSWRWLYAALMLVSALLVYTISHSVPDVWLLAGFGLVGYGFQQLGLAVAPLLAGFVLGPALEANLGRALLDSLGDWGVFVTRPWSLGLLLAALGLLVLRPGLHSLRRPAWGRFSGHSARRGPP